MADAESYLGRLGAERQLRENAPKLLDDNLVAVALGRLTTLQREAIKHVVIGEMPEAKAAEKMGRTRDDVHGYIRGAKTALRRLLLEGAQLQGEPAWDALDQGLELIPTPAEESPPADLVPVFPERRPDLEAGRRAVAAATPDQWQRYEKIIRGQVWSRIKLGVPAHLERDELEQHCRAEVVKAVAKGKPFPISLRVESRLIDLLRIECDKALFERQMTDNPDRAGAD